MQIFFFPLSLLSTLILKGDQSKESNICRTCPHACTKATFSTQPWLRQKDTTPSPFSLSPKKTAALKNCHKLYQTRNLRKLKMKLMLDCHFLHLKAPEQLHNQNKVSDSSHISKIGALLFFIYNIIKTQRTENVKVKWFTGAWIKRKTVS